MSLCLNHKCGIQAEDMCVCGHNVSKYHVVGHPHYCIAKACGCREFKDARYMIPEPSLPPVTQEAINSARTELEALVMK